MTDRIREAAERCSQQVKLDYPMTHWMTQSIESAMREAVADAYTQAMNECARIAAQKENARGEAFRQGELVAAAAFAGGITAANNCEHAIFDRRAEAIRRGEGNGEGGGR